MMKLKYLSILSIFFFLAATLSAQQDWCGTDQELKKYHEQHPEEAKAYQKDLVEFAKQYVQNAKPTSGNKSHTTYVIPVVVHVFHYNGVGNISKRQIDDGIRVINEDFQKLNSDTSAVRSIFQGLIEDVDIEFRLAKIDPNGNCTEGVTRTHTNLTFNSGGAVKSLQGWDPYSYFNVWIVNSIGGTILGFAQFPPPSAGSPSTYGIVVRADEWGSIEMASGTDGRTVTHEVGHALNLLHTFQSGCGSFCQGSGDFVCDTPPQASSLNNSCSFTNNSCSNDAQGGVASNPNPYNTNVPDQLENYMGYGLNCLGMFTPIQKNRMYAAISTYTKLINLVDTANLRQTGTNDGYTAPPCVPTAMVLDFDKFVCAGGQVSFSDDSYGGPLTTYNWSFPGGTPSSSSSATPTITYNTPGDYDVILRVGNASGMDSITLTNYVHVSANRGQGAFGYSESFETATTFTNDWIVVSPSGAPTWTRSTFAGSQGSASLWINNLNNTVEGGLDQLISPAYDMTNVANPSISFDIAYTRRNSSSNDQLRVKYSTDCGASWSTLITLPSSFITASGNAPQTSNFVPTNASQWRAVNLPSAVLPSNVKTSNNVRFMLELVNGNGNNLFLDNININGTLVGLNEQEPKPFAELMVFPNPAQNNTTLQLFTANELQDVEITLTNIVGKKVRQLYRGDLSQRQYKFNIDLTDLSEGIYFVQLNSNKGRKTQKLIVR